MLTPKDKMLTCVERLHCICTFSCSGQRVRKGKAGENRKPEEKGKAGENRKQEEKEKVGGKREMGKRERQGDITQEQWQIL